jgi:hypothetical protein
MIHFRCWYCNKSYAVSEERAGERMTCTCKQRLRVPRRSGQSSRARTLADWGIELLVYGGGGALLGFLLAVVILSRVVIIVRYSWVLVAGLTLLGFLAGVLGGERGVNWIGSLIRRREQR